jgi:hypothetical protein
MRIFKAETRGMQEDDATGATGGAAPMPTPPQQLSAPQQPASAPFATPTTADQANGQAQADQQR